MPAPVAHDGRIRVPFGVACGADGQRARKAAPEVARQAEAAGTHPARTKLRVDPAVGFRAIEADVAPI
jgi:hypothetical protein